MLVLNNIEVRYSKVILVLKGVSLEVAEAKIVTLLGANGAGKSTMLEAISGLLSMEQGEVTDGSIYFAGSRIDHLDAEKIIRMGIVHVLEGRMILAHLSVEENLRLGAQGYQGKFNMKKELDRIYTYFPVLKDMRQRTAGFLSGGEQQMCVIGRALMTKGNLMLLDEPTLGLAPLITKVIFQIIQKANREENMAILLVEQNAQAALDIAEYGYVLEDGRVVLDGTSQQLRENEDIKEFYLGLSAVGANRSYREVKRYKRRRRWLG